MESLALLATVVFQIINPTERVDGTPFAPTEIARNNVYCSEVQGGPHALLSYTRIGPGMFSVELPDGVYFCVGSVTDTEGTESELSDEVQVVVGADEPRARAPQLIVVSVG